MSKVGQDRQLGVHVLASMSHLAHHRSQPHDAIRFAQAGEKTDEEPSTWVSHFDEGSLASEAARCMQQLGKPVHAQRHAERIIELRPADRTRSRAFGQLNLIVALIEQGEPEQACALARDVL